MFQTRCKCFKDVANIQNMFIIFNARSSYLKCVLNVSTAFEKIFKDVANVQNTFIIFKKRC